MPSFPVYERRQGLAGGATASYASPGAFAAPGRALEGLGNAIGAAGRNIGAQIDKTQNSLDDSWFSKARAETALEMTRFEEQSQRAATGDASGYQDTVRGQYMGVRDKWLGQAPSERARQMYDEWSFGYGAKVEGNAAQFRAQSDLARRGTDLASAVLAHSQAILSDPTQYDAVFKRAMDDLEGAKQWMTPEQEAKVREETTRQLNIARAQGDILRDPQAFLKATGLGQKNVTIPAAKVSGDVQTRGNRAMQFFMSRGYSKEQSAGIVGNLVQESGLRASGAVGDAGTAFGLAQWRGERLNRLKRFSAAQGKDWTDFDTQLAFIDSELRTHETAAHRALMNAKTVDEATAAFIGYERPKGWSSGNPRGGHGYRNRLANAAAFAGGEVTYSDPTAGDFANDPRFAGMTPGDVLSLFQQANAASAAMARDQKALETEGFAVTKGAFQLGIATGDASVTQQSILSSNLPDDDKAQLINSLNAKRADTIAAEDALTRIGAGETFDRYDTKDKKGVGLAYERLAGGVSAIDPSDPTGRGLAEYIVEGTGIVPARVSRDIRGGLNSIDPARVSAAASLASTLYAKDRAAVDAAEGGEDLAEAATTYAHLTERLGMTPDEAGKRMVDMADPEKQRQREALLKSEPVKKALGKINKSTIANIFDTYALGDEPAVGENSAQVAMMVAEYREMVEGKLIPAGGDMELAKQLAAAQFRRVYAPTGYSFSSGNVVVRRPPEITYPAGPDGTHDWFGRQAIEALKEKGIEADRVYFQGYDKTEEDVLEGRPPRYAVLFMRNGILEMHPFPFVGDIQAERDRVIGKLRERQEQVRKFFNEHSGEIDPTGPYGDAATRPPLPPKPAEPRRAVEPPAISDPMLMGP
ncbi:MAG: phage tail tip lysozyme [Beijerinckiaceae bacterium]